METERSPSVLLNYGTLYPVKEGTVLQLVFFKIS